MKALQASRFMLSPGKVAHSWPLLFALSFAAVPSQAAQVDSRTSRFDYDAASGLLVKEMVEPADSAACVVTHHERDSVGRIQSTTLRNCNGSASATAGGLPEAAAPVAGSDAAVLSRTTTFTFTPDGRFVATTSNPLGHTETTTYDATFGVGKTLTGPNGLVTEWAYDALGRKTLQKNADGTGVRWTYQYCSSIPGGTDTTCPTVAGATGAFTVTETPVLGPVNITAQTAGAAMGPYSKTYYDTLSRVIRLETQGSDAGMTSRLVYQDTEYNALGQAARKSRPYYQGDAPVWSSVVYDLLGRVISTTEVTGAGNATRTMDYNGLVTVSTDPLGVSTTEVRNVAGQIVTVTDGIGGTLTKAYDPQGNLVRTTDSMGNVTSIRYDSRGRRKELYEPNMGVWLYAYNAFGEMIRQTDAKAQVTTMTYDVLGRMLTKTEQSQNSTWTYDKYANNSVCTQGIGKLCEASVANGFNRKHAYDSLGRLASTTSTVGGAYVSSVSYNATTGRVNVQTYPGGMQVQHLYSSLGYPWKLVDLRTNVALWTSGPRDAEGRLQSYTYGNGIVTSNGYWPEGHVSTTMAGPGGGGGVQMLTHTYDLAGKLTQRVDLVSTVAASYGYDNLGRLLSESRSGGGVVPTQAIGWTYNSIGNMTTRTEGGVTNVYNYPGSGSGSQRPHAVASVSGLVSGLALPQYSYDANGNLTSGAGRTVTWTSFDKVQRIERGTAAVEFVYDADYERATERYWSAGTLLRTTVYLNPAAGAGLYFEEENGTAGLKRKHYISAGGVNVGMAVFNGTTWSMQYWHQDHLGSVSTVTNEAGAVVERLGYEPFGKRRQANGQTDVYGALTPVSTDRGFTGHEHMDEVGLVNMNGRVYDPGLGRFLSADPLVQSPGVLQSYNRYSYVWNSPLNSTDPSGYASLHNEWRNLWHNQTVQAVVTIAIAVFSEGALTPWYEAAAYAAAYTGARVAYDSGSIEQGLKAGVASYASAWAFFGVGQAFSEIAKQSLTAAWIAKVVGHAAVGCASSSAQGGECNTGAASGAIGAVSTPAAGAFGDLVGNKYAGVFVTAVAGGLASKASGGKFSNGAVTGAFGYLFNQLSPKNGDPGDAMSPESHPARGMSDMPGDKAGLYALGGLTLGATGAAIFGPGIAAGLYDLAGGMSLVRFVGAQGEAAVGWIGAKYAITTAAGRTFIADGVTFASVNEVKNVARLSLTPQIRAFGDFAVQSGRQFNLWIRSDTVLSAPLQRYLQSIGAQIKTIPGR